MEATASRYEFRVWAEQLGATETLLRALSDPGPIRESVETYLAAATSTEVNAKVRDGLLDVKTLVMTRDGFEQWTPRTKATFPISAEMLSSELFPLWGIEPPPLLRSHFSLEQLIDEVIESQIGLAAVAVEKRRHALTINGCIAEVADVVIADRAIQTAAIESADLAALHEAVVRVGLDLSPNTSYPRIISETLGWSGPNDSPDSSGGANRWP
jgi:hypothetical protein